MTAPSTLGARLASRLVRWAGVRLFRHFSRPLQEQGSAAVPAGISLEVLDEEGVLELCADANLDLREPAAKAAYARGDLCVAAFESGRPVGYCWLAFAPLPHLDGAWVRFDRVVAWTYKSLVRPSHRGRGIAAALYGFGDAACRQRGCRYSVICVESHNRPSVNAALRSGYMPAGYGAYLLHGSRFVPWSSRQARRLGIVFYKP